MAIGQEEKLVVTDTVDFYGELFEALFKKKNSLEFENVYLSNAQINPDEFKSSILRSQYSQELKGFLGSFIDSNVLNLPLKIFINNSFFPLVIEDAFIKQL